MQTGLRRAMSTNIWRETSEGGRPFPPPESGRLLLSLITFRCWEKSTTKNPGGRVRLQARN